MELRKDYFLDRWVIISEGRGKRPMEVAGEGTKKKGECFFCPGNEHLTPPEIYRVSDGKKWKVRVIPNKFPAVSLTGQKEIRTDNRFYTFAAAYGSHEVLIETPEHKKKFGDLSEEEISVILKTYNNRIKELSRDEAVKYVSVYKNQGESAGASIAHPHSQIVSLNLLPPQVNEKIEAVKKFDCCPYCEIIKSEKNSYRRCFENERFVCFTPYASRFNYETWILPKSHLLTMDSFDEKDFMELASMLKSVTGKIAGVTDSYNFVLFYSPVGENLHFHIEVLPRISIWAGFEFLDGIEINTVSPEYAASYYRGEHGNI